MVLLSFYSHVDFVFVFIGFDLLRIIDFHSQIIRSVFDLFSLDISICRRLCASTCCLLLGVLLLLQGWVGLVIHL